MRHLRPPAHHLRLGAGLPRAGVPAHPQGRAREGEESTPAVLCLHGTDNVVGHGTVVGLGKRPNRGYASELAERGYVTLAPNYPLLAKYQPDLKKLGWESGTLKAVWDNIRGLDLLESLPFVDGRRLRRRSATRSAGTTRSTPPCSTTGSRSSSRVAGWTRTSTTTTATRRTGSRRRAGARRATC